MSELRHEGAYTIVSDEEDWSVRVLGRTGLEYRTDDRVLHIDSEVLAPPHGAAVLPSSIRAWKPPHERQPVTSEDKQRAIDRVRRAFEAWGYGIELA